MVGIPADGGWSGPLGRRLLDVLSERCERLAVVVERRSGQPADPHRAADLTSRAWELLATRPHLVCGAANPWGYLTQCLVTAGVNAAVAERLLVRYVAIQGGGVPTTVSLHRIGQEMDAVDRATADNGVRVDAAHLTARWDTALRQRHADLVSAGAPPRVTATAVDRVVDLVATHRNGHGEAAAKRDRVLAQLGLSPSQASALVALVAGTRRGGSRESLWVRRRDDRAPSDPAITPAVRARIAAYVAGFDTNLQVPA